MDTTKSQAATMAAAGLPRKSFNRLLFDRRYGWVMDEWKDPSEEALAGGRGMFCVLPLAKALMKTASQSINFAASFAVKALERPDVFSPEVLQASLGEQLNKFKFSVRKPQVISLALREDSPSNSGNLRFTSAN